MIHLLTFNRLHNIILLIRIVCIRSKTVYHSTRKLDSSEAKQLKNHYMAQIKGIQKLYKTEFMLKLDLWSGFI